MHKSTVKKLLARLEPGQVLTFFLENGFSVIIHNKGCVAGVTSDSVTGTDVSGRAFCVPLDHIQLIQIKENDRKPRVR